MICFISEDPGLKMGCLHSKKESLDQNPNLFRVVNIDEHGVDLCSGLLEITDTNIVLYREGRESTVWPLHSLRRYGFEEEVFSFESGKPTLHYCIYINWFLAFSF